MLDLLLYEKYTPDYLYSLMNDKNKITHKILEDLRSYGNEGKILSLELLDLSKDEFLSNIHLEELDRCLKNINYFKDNYIQIENISKTVFLDKDIFQENIINRLSVSTRTQIIGTRQSKKSTSVLIYLLHSFIFESDNCIVLCSDRVQSCKASMNRLSDMYKHLPSWMNNNAKISKTSISAGKSKIIINTLNENLCRGLNPNIVFIDSSDNIKNNITSIEQLMFSNTKIIVNDDRFNLINANKFDIVSNFDYLPKSKMSILSYIRSVYDRIKKYI